MFEDAERGAQTADSAGLDVSLDREVAGAQEWDTEGAVKLHNEVGSGWTTLACGEQQKRKRGGEEANRKTDRVFQK